MFKEYILMLLLVVGIASPCVSMTVSNNVEKNGTVTSNRIIDSETNFPIPDVKVELPKQNYTTYTDEQGAFELNADIENNTIMSVEKDGYKPYSLTLNKESAAHPLIIGIEKTNANHMQISNDLIHLGDDNYSETSANAGDFKTDSIGASITKQFRMAADVLKRTNYLVIGSIVGIDTLLARSMGQNRITSAYSTPPEIYFNGQKIAEIQLNGDGQRIKIPKNLIRAGQINEVTIRTGRNLAQRAYTDYDDIELMNLSVTSE